MKQSAVTVTGERKFYNKPKSWADIANVKRQMQVDLLRDAQDGALDAGEAARKLGMTRNLYVISCRRFGVEVDHLLETDHPRYRGMKEAG